MKPSQPVTSTEILSFMSMYRTFEKHLPRDSLGLGKTTGLVTYRISLVACWNSVIWSH